ncbi:similar to Saccharomyces cerevisiae YOL130W ALR1 Plasma membrane Mg(2+) transporter, expression and turnover are regulated by Mg(2+) concentration [Maudiozyma saulgeensis]|uniref:Similar to Saccharomyces cerevisiae YOL130W ALR1 Plasma membrane Mg(2+) transporter, expression and turnover are regulated by Mg(2+) concentration n=1 Tax=Maudiozyma saulgeensis TaxID=1789683 RepID=A0A1X7RAG0_9SACH|nr:similar to Saccharomyces cerevisiae YOL130W ALR1 Plasma membrane Mg(2+) transporter, expression and turnover are regulated by Mg(2+) concentration [Kazachstania saulgeensis]
MSSIHSGSSSSSSSHSDSTNNESLVDSLDSMNTEEHNELYDHRQHNDIIASQIENNNIEVNMQNANNSDVIIDSDEVDPNIRFISEDQQREMDTTDAMRSETINQLKNSPSLVPSHRRESFSTLPTPAITNKNGNTPPSNKKTDRLRASSRQKLSSAESSDPFSSRADGTAVKPGATISPLSRPRRQSRTHSISEKMHSKVSKNKTRTDSIASSSSANPIPLLARSLSHKSMDNRNTEKINKPTGEGAMPTSRRRESFDSDNSQASGESQETEEDVWFPLSPQLHTRINGIDFDELEEFAQSQSERNANYLTTMATAPVTGNFNPNGLGSTSTSTSVSMSSAALKYTPRPSAQQQLNSSSSNENPLFEQSQVLPDNKKAEAVGVSFGNNKIEGEFFDEKPMKFEGTQLPSATRSDIELQTVSGIMPYNGVPYVAPDRFSFFNSSSEETVHSTDIPSLVSKGQSFYDLFKGGQPTWWLDCSCPTDDEMRCIAKAFGIHPLTAEDIRMQETREKVELFKSYYFVCFHTFENDKESEDFLEPINVYIVVFRSGVITFHFNPISHPANVRRRVRQLRDYVDVNSDWICYALIDDITDSFAPVIQSIEYEADAIEDSVFMARDEDFSVMLQRIGESRRKTMTLMRLLSGKADVIKMFAKRCQDEAKGIGPALTSQINIANLQSNYNSNANVNHARRHGAPNHHHIAAMNAQSETMMNNHMASQPRAEIAMYLGDIQDHLLTMYQNLAAYEKIFSRSHSNYLAQLQVESFNSNNRVTEMLGKVTMIGTMLVPLNVITGLFGMNVKVPGEGVGGYGWWFGILGVLVSLAVVGWFAASYWVSRIDSPKTLNEAAVSGSKSIITNFLPRGYRNRSAREHENRNKNSNRSIASLPTRYSGYQ